MSTDPSTAPITEFQGEYRFLSNFWLAPIRIGPYVFPSSEHAYQAAKSLDPDDWKDISECVSPGAAKRLGQRITMRTDWEGMKLDAMAQIIAAKFDQHADLKSQLLFTAPRELIEGNHWGDTFWGMCNGRGENHLGRILMAYRAREAASRAQGVAEGWKARAERAEAETERLSEALRPFADIAEAYDPPEGDDDYTTWDRRHTPTIGMLRRARATLEGGDDADQQT